jgi:putative NADH-flavin reductase
VVKGDIFNPDSLAPIFRGHDVIISVLGFPKQVEEVMVKFTQTMESILKAMKIANVQRLITISAWYTDPNTRKGMLNIFCPNFQIMFCLYHLIDQ